MNKLKRTGDIDNFFMNVANATERFNTEFQWKFKKKNI